MPLKKIISLIIGLLLLYALFTVGSPFLLALILAILLEPVVQLLVRFGKFNRFASVTTVFLLFTFLFLTVSYWIGVKIIVEVIDLTRNFPIYVELVRLKIDLFMERQELFYETLPPDKALQIQAALEQGIQTGIEHLNKIIGVIGTTFVNLAKGIPMLFVYMIVFFLALFLFSFHLPNMRNDFLKMFELQSREKVSTVLDNLKNAILGFINAQLLISVLTYTVTLIGLLILGAPYPLAIALLIIVVDILPILGTGAVIIPWSIYSLIAGDMYLGVGLITLWVFITVFRRIIEPKILGHSIGISALAALVSLYVGFQLVGVVGLFLGPVTMIIYKAMKKVGLIDINIKI
jgi:sporulation integral membrane protein YtvI